VPSFPFLCLPGFFLFGKNRLSFLYPPLLPPTGSDSSTRIMFLEQFHNESIAVVLSSSRGTTRRRTETAIFRRGFSASLSLFFFSLLSFARKIKNRAKVRRFRANFALAREPSIVRREPRTIMNYLAAAVSCRADRDDGLFFFPGSDGFRFSADAVNSAGRSRGS